MAAGPAGAKPSRIPSSKRFRPTPPIFLSWFSPFRSSPRTTSKKPTASREATSFTANWPSTSSSPSGRCSTGRVTALPSAASISAAPARIPATVSPALPAPTPPAKSSTTSAELAPGPAQSGLRLAGPASPVSPRHPLGNRSIHPRQKSFYRHEHLAVQSNNLLSLPSRRRSQNLPRGLLGAHLYPCRNGVCRLGMKLSLVVHPPDIAHHKPRADQRHLHSRSPQLRGNAVRQRANREFAHAIGRSPGSRHPAGNTGDEHHVSPAFLDLRQRGIHRSQHSEYIGLELSPVILKGKLLERAVDSEARVREHRVQLAPLADGFRHRPLHVAISRDVALSHQRSCGPNLRDPSRHALQLFPASRGECNLRPGLPQLPCQLFPDPRRRSRDEHNFAPKIRSYPVHAATLPLQRLLYAGAVNPILSARRSLSSLVDLPSTPRLICSTEFHSIDDWRNYLSLPRPREARRRRHGCCL